MGERIRDNLSDDNLSFVESISQLDSILWRILKFLKFEIKITFSDVTAFENRLKNIMFRIILSPLFPGVQAETKRGYKISRFMLQILNIS